MQLLRVRLDPWRAARARNVARSPHSCCSCVPPAVQLHMANGTGQSFRLEVTINGTRMSVSWLVGVPAVEALQLSFDPGVKQNRLAKWCCA